MNTLGCVQDCSLVSNAFSFLRFPLEYYPYTLNADWIITGVPFDLTTTGRSGSRYGPNSIRESSTHLAWENFRWSWDFDVRKRLKVVDCGDLVFNFGDVKDMSDKLQIHAKRILSSGKKMLSFGGDHYITLPLLRAYSKYFNKKLGIIHFDAHTDMYYSNSQYDHGSFLLRAVSEELIDLDHALQIGIRTEYNDSGGFVVFDVDYINTCDIHSLLNRMESIVSVFDVPFYLTFDIDCLDPSVAPGTGTPVIGGLSVSFVLKLLRHLKFCNIVGIDIVEVAPIYDCAQITSLAAANIALEMLYVVAQNK